MTIETISVYCGSSYPTGEEAPVYIKAIRDLGCALGKKPVLVRYGGGLYGHLQDLMEAVGHQGGKMQAVLSSAYYKPEEIYPPYVEVIQLETDLERAELFLGSDASIVTPGGDGTFSESCFAHNRNLSLLFSQKSMKPVVFLNIDGFYDHIKAHFQQMAAEGYSNEKRQAALHFVPSVAAAMETLGLK